MHTSTPAAAPILVTGSAGFIGSHLVEALLARGERVVGIDNFDPFYERVVKVRNLAGVAEHPRFTLEDVDLRDARGVDSVFERHRPKQVFHFAAKAGVRPSLLDPAGYMAVNTAATADLLANCARSTVEHVVFASSSSVYGDSCRLPFREDEPCGQPLSPYAASKFDAEATCRRHVAATGMPITCLRLFTVYGPRQRPDLAIHRFVRAIAEGRPITLYGDGSSRRDYTHVSDIVTGALAAMDRPGGFRVFNLGRGVPATLAETVRMIEVSVGREAVIERLPPQEGDLDQTWADISLAARELGFEPVKDLENGIREFVAWWRSTVGDGSGACAAS